MRYTCAIFDLDGTLVDSTRAHAEAWQEALDRHGLHSPVEKYYADIGMGSRDIVKKHLPRADDQTVERILVTQRTLFQEEFLAHVEPYPSASTLLQDLHRLNTRIVLASSSPRELIGRLVNLLDAADTILGWVGGDEVSHGKPAPDIFLAACRLCKAQPEETIVVGDSPYDVEAAHRGGFPCIALLQSGFSPESLRGAEHLYADLTDLLSHISGIWGRRSCS
jgi:membrane protein